MVSLPKVFDVRGNLTFIEGEAHFPVSIKRVYYTYDVPGGEVRGGHAHRRCHEMLIAVSGSFDVLLEDGAGRQRFFLNRPNTGLYVPPMTWRMLENFSSGSVCLVIASELYDPEEYIRDFDEFSEQVSLG